MYELATTYISIKQLDIYVYSKTSTLVFKNTPFIIAKTWKQPKCPLLIECTKLTGVYIYTTECNSVQKRNELQVKENL